MTVRSGGITVYDMAHKGVPYHRCLAKRSLENILAILLGDNGCTHPSYFSIRLLLPPEREWLMRRVIRGYRFLPYLLILGGFIGLGWPLF